MTLYPFFPVHYILIILFMYVAFATSLKAFHSWVSAEHLKSFTCFFIKYNYTSDGFFEWVKMKNKPMKTIFLERIHLIQAIASFTLVT